VTNLVIKTTELLVFCLPFIKLLVIIGVIAAAVVYLFRVSVGRQWLRISTRIVGALLVLPLVAALLLLLLMVACDTRPRVLVSPDSQHVAEYSYEAGFLGRDSTSVTVRKKWSVFPDVAYQYAGPSDWTSTEVRWLSNERLLVRYSGDGEGRFQECKAEAAGIVVQCITTK
jgi:hypothetical protein